MGIGRDGSVDTMGPGAIAFPRSTRMTSKPPDLQPEARIGEVVDGRYRILAHLATGGMASVYRAEHVNNGALAAVKVLHRVLTESEEIAARFRREALAARSIRHPNVVSVWDIGKLADGCIYMVQEYIPGEDLCMLLHREKPLAQARAIKIALQVAHALVSAHAAGVVHRDLKPDNIMLVERAGHPDFVKVVDFGIAKMPVRSGPALTALGSVFGTPEYMAPEQARGTAVDHRTDLYTLGTVLYEMLAGRPPFADEQFSEVLIGQISKPPPPLAPAIDSEIAALVMQLLEKDPADRVQTAADLVERLAAILARLAPDDPVLAAMASGQDLSVRASERPQGGASAPAPMSVPSALPAPAPSAPPPMPTAPAQQDSEAKATVLIGCGVVLLIALVATIVALVRVLWVAS
jgi:eukaryotic-like serine/threonine-protein kinase